MGYLVKAVQTGLEYAEKYHVQEFVSKARTSSKSVDTTVAKIDLLLRAQGTPLVEKIDTQLDTGVAYGQRVVGGVREAKAKTVEYAQEKLTVVYEPVYEKTALVKEKYGSMKQDAFARVEETKGKLYEKAQDVVTVSCSKMDQVQTKAASSKAYAEKQLLVGAQAVDKVLKVDERLGSPYTEQAAALAMKTADRALDISYGTAQHLLQKAAAMPLTLKERMEQSAQLAQETTSKAKAFATDAPSKALVFLLAAKVQLYALAPAILTQKDILQASYENGTLSKTAKEQYARAVGYVQSWVPTTATVAPYVEQAQQAAAKLATAARTQAAKVQFLQDPAQRSAFLETSKARATALLELAASKAQAFRKAKAA